MSSNIERFIERQLGAIAAERDEARAALLRETQRQEAWINAKLGGQTIEGHGELCWTAPGLAYALCSRDQAVADWRKYLGLDATQ